MITTRNLRRFRNTRNHQEAIPPRNPSRKPPRKPPRTPSRKPSQKTPRKPTRKPTQEQKRKPARKQTRKPTRKPPRKPSRKPTRNPSRESSRNESNWRYAFQCPEYTTTRRLPQMETPLSQRQAPLASTFYTSPLPLRHICHYQNSCTCHRITQVARTYLLQQTCAPAAL